MIDVYKYQNGLYNTDSPAFEYAPNKAGTRGHNQKLFPHHCRLRVRSNFFSERIVSVWNSLPDEVVRAPSVNSFKSRLDNFWENLPSRFNPVCQN